MLNNLKTLNYLYPSGPLVPSASTTLTVFFSFSTMGKGTIYKWYAWAHFPKHFPPSFMHSITFIFKSGLKSMHNVIIILN